MRHERRGAFRKGWLGVALAGSLVVAACGGGGDGGGGGSTDGGGFDPTTDTREPVTGGTLIIAGEAEVGSAWTPAAIRCDSFCQMRARSFFEPIAVTGEDLEVYPWLAETIEANETSTEFTIKLREGIKFTDGSDFNAEVAEYNLQRTGTGLLIKPALVDLAKNADGSIKIDIVDDYTLKFYTGKNGDIGEPVEWPLFPFTLTTQWGFMASKQWLEAVADGSAKATEPVGTGPFIATSYVPDDKLVVERNPDYWAKDADGNQLPYLDKIEFRVITDSRTRQQVLEAGEVDLIATSDPNVIKPLSENAAFNWIRQEKYGEIGFLLMNQAKEGPLTDQRIRCAIAGAIEQNVLIAATGAGFQEPATGMMSPGQEGYLEESPFPSYDVDAATALVDEYKTEKGLETVSFLYSTAQSASNQATAQYLQTELAKIGIDMEIRQVEQSALVNEAITGADTFEMFLWRLHAGIYVDQQNFWWNSASIDPASPLSLNFGRIQDEEVDRLLAEARSESDPAARKSIAEDINRRMGEQCWYIPLAFTKWAVVASPDVSGFGRLPIAGADTNARDGAGFPGQVMVHTLFKAAS